MRIGVLLAGIFLIGMLYYAAIAVVIVVAINVIVYSCYQGFLSIYFSSKKFARLQASIKDNIQDCNELNLHIEELKHSYNKYYEPNLDTSISSFADKSSWNYLRPELNKYKEASNIYYCSRQVCANARVQPFKYICKYFNIIYDEDSLNFFEDLVNKFSAVEQGKKSYIAERAALIESVHTKVPDIIMKFSLERLYRELGIQPFKFEDKYYPSYQFLYVSSGGNSSLECIVELNLPVLEKFVHYLASILEKKKSIKYQRQLMTTELREQIKSRDGYRCISCGASLEDEPNLLLEIDHIIPVSKGGKTEPVNLQTLCWRCNRRKSDKLIL